MTVLIIVSAKTLVEIEFDPAKDAANIQKHGISLSRFVDLEGAVFVVDCRYAEQRFRVYRLINGDWHCAAITMRADVFRVISFPRAHGEKVKRHA